MVYKYFRIKDKVYDLAGSVIGDWLIKFPNPSKTNTDLHVIYTLTGDTRIVELFDMDKETNRIIWDYKTFPKDENLYFCPVEDRKTAFVVTEISEEGVVIDDTFTSWVSLHLNYLVLTDSGVVPCGKKVDEEEKIQVFHSYKSLLLGMFYYETGTLGAMTYILDENGDKVTKGYHSIEFDWNTMKIVGKTGSREEEVLFTGKPDKISML